VLRSVAEGPTVSAAGRASKGFEPMSWSQCAIESPLTTLVRHNLIDAVEVEMRASSMPAPVEIQERDLLARRAFRSILGACLDRPDEDPDLRAAAVVQQVIAQDWLQDEVILQLCKQMRHNPRPASSRAASALLLVVLRCVCVSDGAENHVEEFLLRRGKTRHIEAMHVTKCILSGFGARRQANHVQLLPWRHALSNGASDGRRGIDIVTENRYEGGKGDDSG